MTTSHPSAQPQIVVHTEIGADGDVVTGVIGVLDAATTPALERHLESVVTGGRLDLRLTNFISAAGVTALLTRRPKMTGLLVSPAVSKILTLCDLQSHFDIISAETTFAFGSAEFGICLMDEKHRFGYINPSLAAIHGVSAKDHIGRRPEDIFVAIEEDCTDINTRVMRSQTSEAHVVHSSFNGLELACLTSYHPATITDQAFVTVVVQPMLQPPTDHPASATHRIHAVAAAAAPAHPSTEPTARP